MLFLFIVCLADKRLAVCWLWLTEWLCLFFGDHFPGIVSPESFSRHHFFGFVSAGLFLRDHLEETHQNPDAYHEEADTEKRIGDDRSGVEIENATSDYHREDAAHYG